VRDVYLLRGTILIATELYVPYNYKVKHINYSLGMFSSFTGGDDSANTNRLKGK